MNVSDVKLPEAIEVCEGWFAYLDRQKARSIEVQKLASMARAGQQEEAQRRLRQLDQMSVTVYDGGRLEPAVRKLLSTIARLEAELAAARKKLAAISALCSQEGNDGEPYDTVQGIIDAMKKPT
jgi:hypothetical protein